MKIEKLEEFPYKYAVQDEYGYTDSELVSTVNNIIKTVNELIDKANNSEDTKVSRDKVINDFLRRLLYEYEVTSCISSIEKSFHTKLAMKVANDMKGEL